jgi:hypothetical protein
MGDIVEKLRDASTGIIAAEKVETILEGLLHLEEAEDVAPLLNQFSTSNLVTAQ